jgi:hypothetical protein
MLAGSNGGTAMAHAQVFISYNRTDAALAAPPVTALKALGIRVRIDREQLPPGRPWRPAGGQALLGCTAVAVLIGPNGLDPVHEQEMAAALSRARASGEPVIPVLLPGAREPPPLLGQYGHVRIPEAGSPDFSAAIGFNLGLLVAGEIYPTSTTPAKRMFLASWRSQPTRPGCMFASP